MSPRERAQQALGRNVPAPGPCGVPTPESWVWDGRAQLWKQDRSVPWHSLRQGRRSCPHGQTWPYTVALSWGEVPEELSGLGWGFQSGESQGPKEIQVQAGFGHLPSGVTARKGRVLLNGLSGKPKKLGRCCSPHNLGLSAPIGSAAGSTDQTACSACSLR